MTTIYVDIQTMVQFCTEAAILSHHELQVAQTESAQDFMVPPDHVGLQKTQITILSVCSILSFGATTFYSLGLISSGSQMYCTQPVSDL